MRVEGAPAAALAGRVATGYYGFRERTAGPLRRREGPGAHVVLVVSFGEDWVIDSRRVQSFVGGLHRRQVTTEHGGRAFGIHVNLAPPAAHVLLQTRMDALAGRVEALEDVLEEPFLVERLHDAPDWASRFALLDAVLKKRFARTPPPSPELVWAWRRLVETDGRAAVGSVARELGWSGKRIVARFRREIGLTPKAAAKLLRFERARSLAQADPRPDWARIARDCGYYDQSHLINDFKVVTGRTPATFFQDTAGTAA